MIAAQEVGRWEKHVCLSQLAGGKISSGVPQLTSILKGSLPFLPRLCQFSESTLLDLWPHLKYSMHPSSIFHGIPESLYYCVNCNSYPTRQISLSSQSLSSQEWEWQVKEKGFSDYSDSDSKIYGISQFLLVWNLQRLIVKLRLSQVAAVVHSDYSYSGSIPIPGKLQWLIPGRVSQSNEIDTFGKSWNKRNKDIKIHR